MSRAALPVQSFIMDGVVPSNVPAEIAVVEKPLHQQLDELQNEIASLKAELNMLRRRDATINFSMTRFDEEMRLAARLQQDFLPRVLPEVGAARFHTLFRPAGYVSGDLYDVMRLDETHVGFFIVDSVGHGMPAALLTMFIKRALITKEISKTSPGGYRLLSPSETLSRLNDALIEQELSQATFATGVYGIIDTRSLEISLCSAGHPPPILLRGDELQLLEGSGSLLGIFPNENYTTTTTQLRQGDRLLLYSDGIEVAFAADEASCTPPSSPCWRDALYAKRSLTAEQMIVTFAEELDREFGSLQPKDDLTVVMLHVT